MGSSHLSGDRMRLPAKRDCLGERAIAGATGSAAELSQ